MKELLKAPYIMWKLKRNQRLKPAELRKLQNKKLRAIIKHSYNYVPYYHKLFSENRLRPDDIKTIDDLDKIPISNKNDIKDSPLEETVAANIDLSKCRTLRTSGTTGTPLSIYMEKKAMLIHQLQIFRWQLSCGDKMTNRHMAIGASWLRTHPIQNIGIFKTKHVSAFDSLETQIEKIGKFDPKTIIAYPSCVRILAKEIKDRDIQGINIHLIFTGGERLDEYTRKLTREAFDAETFNSYGASEVGGICRECVKRTGYHISGDSVLVEIIRDCERVSTGEEGEITVTNLTNYAMPFIRYNMKDLGILMEDECSCGSPFPLMRITQGRKSDIVQLPDGRVIPALTVYGGLSQIQGIKQLQVIQETIDHFTVKIMKESKFTDATYEEVKRNLKQKLGDVKIEVLIVDSIPREHSGKFKQFITKFPVTS